MRVLDADFARSRGLGHFSWRAGAVATLAMVAALQASQAWLAMEQIATIRVQSESLVIEPAPRAPVPIAPRPYQADAMQIVRTSQFDWAAVMAPLFASRVNGVRVSSLSIDAVEHRAVLEVEATGIEDLMAYEATLNAGEPTQQWRFRRLQSAVTTTGAIRGEFDFSFRAAGLRP